LVAIKINTIILYLDWKQKGLKIIFSGYPERTSGIEYGSRSHRSFIQRNLEFPDKQIVFSSLLFVKAPFIGI
jgi:hypothetical protein